MRVSEMILEEWNVLFKDKRLLFVLLLIPLFFILVFGSTYSQGKIRSLPTVYFDENHSGLSRQMIQAFSASETFELLGESHSEDALMDRLQSGDAVVGIIIPVNFGEKVSRGEQAELITVIDGSNIMLVNSALNAANEVTQTFSGGIAVKRVEAQGLTPSDVLSLRSNYRMLFNPGLSYGLFMPLGLLGAVVQQVILLGVSLCMTRYKEKGMPDVNLWKWLYAKSLPYFLLGMFHVTATMCILIKGYHFPFVGGAAMMLILSVLFVGSLIGLGLLVSTLSPNALQATQISMLLAVLSFPLSGYTWPFIAMPKALAVVGHLFPLTYFLHGLQEIAMKGNDWGEIQTDFIGLCLIALVTLGTVGFVLTWRRNRKQNRKMAC